MLIPSRFILIIYIKQYLCWLSVCLSLSNTCSFSHISGSLCSRTSWQQFQPVCWLKQLCPPSFWWFSAAIWPLPFAPLPSPLLPRSPALYQHVLLSVLFSREQMLMSFLAMLLSPSPEPWIRQIVFWALQRNIVVRWTLGHIMFIHSWMLTSLSFLVLSFIVCHWNPNIFSAFNMNITFP